MTALGADELPRTGLLAGGARAHLTPAYLLSVLAVAKGED